MILNTGSRTDIPAFFSDWFYRRVGEGFVMARNPYRPELVSRYALDPQVVDSIVFCTKNPAPMLPRLAELAAFRQFWFVACPHGCVYCYANHDRQTVERNLRMHDPESPLLIGHLCPGDIVRDANQESYLARQLPLF